MAKGTATVERVNILFLDNDPVRAAVMHNDRDLITQAQEVVQLLASVCALKGVKRVPYKLTHARHPSVLWVLSSHENYVWAWTHLVALLFEYTRRYGRPQLMEQLKHHEFMFENAPDLPDEGLTPFPKIFPGLPYGDIKDPVQAYRTYYVNEKPKSVWKEGNVPFWFRDTVIEDAEEDTSSDEDEDLYDDEDEDDE